jgi:hypothetical protein
MHVFSRLFMDLSIRKKSALGFVASDSAAGLHASNHRLGDVIRLRDAIQQGDATYPPRRPVIA